MRHLLMLALVVMGQGDWVGQRVFTKYGTVLKVGKAVVDDEDRSRDMAVSGHDRRSIRVYRVERVNGPWLWLSAEKGGAEGWARVENVVLFDQAIDYFTNEIRANPNWAVYNSRGTIWKEKGEYDIAIADYNEAIRLDPKNEVAYSNRGLAWYYKKEYDRAIADYGEAIRLDPKYALAYNNRAWLRATCPDDKYRDGKKAYEDASRAYQLAGGNAYSQGTLAAAYAECGDFDAAVKWQEKALGMYTGEKDKKDGLARLELYRAKKPYRQSK